MRLLMIACVLLATAACQKADEPWRNTESVTSPSGPTKGVDRSQKGSAAPAVVFLDPDGGETALKSFAGKPTLVNLWASWCAPCVKELPTLDRLARAQDGRLNVVAISQDTGPQASVEAFLKTHKIASLESYQDPKMALSGGLGSQVLPTSVLYDATGKEVWRFVGDLDWTGAEAAKLLREAGVATAG